MMATRTEPTQVPFCTVRGHDHTVYLVRNLEQDGTGHKAFVWACPTGKYRWFQLAAHNYVGFPLSSLTRSSRPRSGWKD